MYAAPDDTIPKRPTFGVKQPSVHHFLYPFCTYSVHTLHSTRAPDDHSFFACISTPRKVYLMERTFPVPPSPVSKKTFVIAGILVTVYGLDELRCNIKHVASLYLLHPRLQTQTCMEHLAASSIRACNSRLLQNKIGDTSIGLIAVTFDQRNHGSRQVKKLANEDWRSGNGTHAQDMFSVFHGTAVDVSLLITHLSSYIFPTSNHTITTNMVCGVSLGGHGAWVSNLLYDRRIRLNMARC